MKQLPQTAQNKRLYFAIGHLALLLPGILVFETTNGMAILDLLLVTLGVAGVLFCLAFVRRDEVGISATRLALHGVLTTLLFSAIWFSIFLLVSWFTVDTTLLVGLIFALPLGAVSTGLRAVLRMGCFGGEGTPGERADLNDGEDT